mmetsp:Transcript_8085/g.13073  ORF Transcript_8085/g.13073 Transcript_8085/m.13073 type:complete len:121 (-) Transcript_8085:46-408(-)
MKSRVISELERVLESLHHRLKPDVATQVETERKCSSFSMKNVGKRDRKRLKSLFKRLNFAGFSKLRREVAHILVSREVEFIAALIMGSENLLSFFKDALRCVGIAKQKSNKENMETKDEL